MACNEVGPPLVKCVVCHASKKPRGRSAPLGAYYCDYECEGYRLDPQPHDLWPGEVCSLPHGEPGTAAETAEEA